MTSAQFCDLYSLPASSLDTLPLLEFLSSNAHPNHSLLQSFRNHCKSLHLNPNSPLLFLSPLISMGVFEMCEGKGLKSFTKNFSTVQLCSVDWLSPFPLNLQQTSLFFRIPSLFSHLERVILSQELRNQLQVPMKTPDVMRATQTVSYDKNENYESMETLGDCVLKFVIS